VLLAESEAHGRQRLAVGLLRRTHEIVMRVGAVCELLGEAQRLGRGAICAVAPGEIDEMGECCRMADLAAAYRMKRLRLFAGIVHPFGMWAIEAPVDLAAEEVGFSAHVGDGDAWADSLGALANAGGELPAGDVPEAQVLPVDRIGGRGVFGNVVSREGPERALAILAMAKAVAAIAVVGSEIAEHVEEHAVECRSRLLRVPQPNDKRPASCGPFLPNIPIADRRASRATRWPSSRRACFRQRGESLARIVSAGGVRAQPIRQP